MITKIAARDLFVELVYTRDRRVDHPDGSWSCFPAPPEGDCWIVWDIWPDRKTGWLRVWGKGVGRIIQRDGGWA